MVATIGFALALQGPAPTFREEKFEKDIRIVRHFSYGYVTYLPFEYEKERRRWPLVVFLHGSGERGANLEQMYIHGPMKEIKNGRRFPFVAIAPQCPPGQWWDADGVNALTESICRKYRIDRSRVYLTGLSMGGFGTWAAAYANPKRYAAIAPICGGGETSWAPVLAKIPTWNTHGDADGAVNIQQSIDLIAAIHKAGGDARFTIVKGGGHDVWTDVYAGKEIWDWLLSHSLKK